MPAQLRPAWRTGRCGPHDAIPGEPKPVALRGGADVAHRPHAHPPGQVVDLAGRQHGPLRRVLALAPLMRHGFRDGSPCPRCPRTTVELGNVDTGRGHCPGTGVPGVPALSNSLSPCPVAKSGCNTCGAPAARCYSRSLRRWRAISVPLAPAKRGTSRALMGRVAPLFSMHDSNRFANFQAGHAGSIPVIRSYSSQLILFIRLAFRCFFGTRLSRVPVVRPTALRHRLVSRCRCSRFQRRACLCPQVRMLPQPSAGTRPVAEQPP